MSEFLVQLVIISVVNLMTVTRSITTFAPSERHNCNRDKPLNVQGKRGDKSIENEQTVSGYRRI